MALIGPDWGRGSWDVVGPKIHNKAWAQKKKKKNENFKFMTKNVFFTLFNNAGGGGTCVFGISPY